jgi:arsenate reductase
MAEAILRHIGGDRFEALSAGSRPAGFVHPLALKTIETFGMSTEGLESKHWSMYADRPIDICLTVCDNASAECPIWPGPTVQVHWGLPDPAYFEGEEAERIAFADEIGNRIKSRLQALVRLPLSDMAPERLRDRLESMTAI